MIRGNFLLCALALPLMAQPLTTPPPALVWSLDGGGGTAGRFGAFQSSTCQIDLQLTSEARRGTAGLGMRIDYKSGGGPCGVWMHLFDETDSSARGYPDSRSFPFLSFWARGESGSEDAEVRMADPQWLARDDSKPAGLISRYRGGPIARTWSEVIIPCLDFHLTSPHLAVFVLSFAPGSHGVLQVDDIALKSKADYQVPPVDLERIRTG